MEPRIKYFLILNAIIFSLIILYVRFFNKKNEQDMAQENLSPDGFSGRVNIDYHKQTQGTHKDYKNFSLLSKDDSDPVTVKQNLNVIFTWNGHDWDAYEVLGIPSGSSIGEVKDAYEKALLRVDEKSQEFIKKAYGSICQKVS